LEFLFGTLPKPLVLKSDNEFDADLFAQCLQRHKVFHLLSPPCKRARYFFGGGAVFGFLDACSRNEHDGRLVNIAIRKRR
jgi:hypothetical protein